MISMWDDIPELSDPKEEVEVKIKIKRNNIPPLHSMPDQESNKSVGHIIKKKKKIN